MQKLTDLTKAQLIDLIIRERESAPLQDWYPMKSNPLDGSPFLVVNESGGMDVVCYQDGRLVMPKAVLNGGMAVAWQRLPVYLGNSNG